MQDNQSSGRSALVGFVAGVVAATVAGGYYLYGPEGRRHRRQVRHAVGRVKEKAGEARERTRRAAKAAARRADEELEEFEDEL